MKKQMKKQTKHIITGYQPRANKSNKQEKNISSWRSNVIHYDKNEIIKLKNKIETLEKKLNNIIKMCVEIENDTLDGKCHEVLGELAKNILKKI